MSHLDLLNLFFRLDFTFHMKWDGNKLKWFLHSLEVCTMFWCSGAAISISRDIGRLSYKHFSCIQKPEMHYMTKRSWNMCLIMGIWISDSFEPVNWVMFNFYAQKTRLLKSCVCVCAGTLLANEWMLESYIIARDHFLVPPKGKCSHPLEGHHLSF